MRGLVTQEALFESQWRLAVVSAIRAVLHLGVGHSALTDQSVERVITSAKKPDSGKTKAKDQGKLTGRL